MARWAREEGISEVIGTIILVGVVMVGIALLGILLLSNPIPKNIPAFDYIITNQSKTVYIYHKGGDALQQGTYSILVNGGDQTANFTNGTQPWVIGQTLSNVTPTMPFQVVIVFNQGNGGGTVIGESNLLGMVSIVQPQSSWYGNQGTITCNWKYRKQFSINHNMVNGTLTSFPVLINLSGDPDLSGHARSDGNDILFTSSDGMTPLPFEIENYTSTSGTLVAWVNVPALSPLTDTVLYMYYGNASSSSQQNPNAVWGSTYYGVWHLNETSGTTLHDSSSSANTGTASGGVTLGIAGKIGNAVTLDGSSGYIYTTNSANSPQDLTYEFWFKTTQAKGTPIIGFESSRTGTGSTHWDRYIYVGTDGKVYYEFGTTGSMVAVSSSTYNNGNWHHVGAVHYASNNSFYLYMDGNLAGVNTSGTPGESSTNYWRFGSYLTNPSPNSANGYFPGSIDEVRISNIPRSSSWIATDFANQNTPSTFYTVGNEEKYWKC